MTFGPWVLVKVFKQPEQTMAKLSIAYCVVGLVVQPAVGRLIDRLGERTMLVAEGLVLMCVCVTYAVAGAWPASGAALSAIMTVYVVDQLCFSVSMARTTYLAKIVESPEDLSGGLASGVSIDHLASMSLPMLGGLVWEAFGFRYVFWGASAIAVAMAAVSFGIRTPERTGPGAAAAAGKAAE
jgi:predicted MFS family arabinose efflux permease